MSRVFDDLPKAQQRVFQKLAADERSFQTRRRQQAKTAGDEAAKAQGSPYRQSGRAYDQDTKAHEDAEKKKTATARREQKIRDQIRENSVRHHMAQLARDDRAQVTARRAAGERRYEYGRAAIGDMSRVARGVIGGAGDIARGAGIDPSLGGMTARVIGAEQTAIRSTVSGKAARGQVASSGDVAGTLGSIKSASDATSISYANMGNALERFVTRSADLENGKLMLEDMGRIANASGVDIGDLAEAAGSLSANMTGYGDSAEESARKSKDLLGMLRMLAKQGAMGSVEIKDMATYLPKIAAAANMVGGDRKQIAGELTEQLGRPPSEQEITAGLYSKNVGQLGAIAQESMKGGRATAGEAIRASQAFVLDLMKPSTQKYLGQEGINVWEDEGKTKLHSSENIIKSIYAKTGGDNAKMASLMRNIQGASAIRGFGQTYYEAGGGAAGLEAISKRFRQFEQTFTPDQIAQASSLTEQSKGGRAVAAQNRLDTAWASALEQLVPIAERLAPRAGELADKFAALVVTAGQVVEWAANNPGKAITAAIVASIAKAALGEAVAGGIKSMLGGGLGKGGGVPAVPGAPGGGGFGGGGALAIVAGAVAITAAGVTLIDEGFKNKEAAEAATEGVLNTGAEARANAAVRGSDEDIAALEAHLQKLGGALRSAEESSVLDKTTVGSVSGALNWMTAGSVGTSFDAQQMNAANADRKAELVAEVEATTKALEAAKARRAGQGDGGGRWWKRAQGIEDEGGSWHERFLGTGKAATQKAGGDQAAAQMGTMNESLAALNAVIKGGIRVTNLAEIKIPGPGAPRTGPDAG